MPQVLAVTEDEVRVDLARGYEAVAKAETAGARVDDLFLQLDDVARKYNGADSESLEDYRLIITSVIIEAASAESAGRLNETSRLIGVSAVIVVIMLIGYLVWSRGSSWFWRAWMRMHRGWRVEKV